MLRTHTFRSLPVVATTMLGTLAFTAQAPAQELRRSWMEVTPEGVFLKQESPRAESAAPGSPATPRAPSAAGLHWTYANPPATPWITQSVSLGNHGTLAWLGQNLNGESVSLLGASETDPPTPIWEEPFGGAGGVVVAGASRSPSGLVGLPSQPGVVWHYLPDAQGSPQALNLPAGAQTGTEIAISDDGSTAAIAYTDAANTASVALYDLTSGSSTPTRTITIPAVVGMREHDLSGDGSTVLIASHTDNYVYDTATGQKLFEDSSTVSHDAHAINGDGTAWGRGGFDVGVWESNGATYIRTVNYNDFGLGFPVYTACGISADGSTFVTAAYDATSAEQFRVYCFDLQGANPSQPIWTFQASGAGSFQDVPTSIQLSDDGRWIGVGSWGSGTNSHPEAMLFDRDLGNVPVTSVDTPGSVFSLDVDPRGQLLVAGTKAVHANTFGNGGEGYSLDRGGEDFWVTGTPGLLRPITLRVSGSPGDFVLWMASLAALEPPVPFGTMGNLAIDPTVWVLRPSPLGVVPGTGTLVASGMVIAPSAVGLTVFLQAARIGVVRQLTNRVTLYVNP